MFGSLPPPIGGVTRHVERLAQLLAGQGARVTVADIHAKKGVPQPAFCERVPVGSFRGKLKIFRRLLSADVVHIHSSGANQPLREIIGMLAGRLTGARILLTIHGGHFPARATNASMLKRLFLRWELHLAHRVHLVNADLVPSVIALDTRLGARCVVASPYIPYVGEIPTPQDGDPIVAIATGAWSPTYGFDTVALALAELEEDRSRFEMRIFSYYLPDATAAFRASVEEVLSRATPKVELREATMDLRELYGKAHIYIRASRADGDSLAVREALDAGLLVIASDAAPRPPGARLFVAGDAASLRHALVAALHSIRTGAHVGGMRDHSPPQVLRAYDGWLPSRAGTAGVAEDVGL